MQATCFSFLRCAAVLAIASAIGGVATAAPRSPLTTEQQATFCGKGTDDAISGTYGEAVNRYLNVRAKQGVNTEQALAELAKHCTGAEHKGSKGSQGGGAKK